MTFQIRGRPTPSGMAILMATAAMWSAAAAPAFSLDRADQRIQLTPQQHTALLLGRWETCVDVTTRHLAKNVGSIEQTARNVTGNCEEFGAKLEPAVKAALRSMMYLSSDKDVADQTASAMAVLRRHVHARAVSAVQKARNGSASSAR